MDKLEAVFFDLDGTLLNTIGDIANSYNYSLTLHGIKEYTDDEYKNMVGSGTIKLCEQLCSEDNEDKIESVNKEAIKKYTENPVEHTYPYDGIQESVEVLKSRGIKLAILSNKPDALVKAIIKNFFSVNDFEIIKGQTEEYPVKPDPSSIKQMCEDMDVDPENCIYVGDTLTDIMTAKNSGMKSVSVTWGFRDKDYLISNNPDYIIDDTADIASLPEIFEEII